MTGLAEGAPSRPAAPRTTGEHDDTLVAAARRIGVVLRDAAEDGERVRRLPAPTVRALGEAGFFGLCRPRRLGGLEADPLTVFAVVEELARRMPL